MDQLVADTSALVSLGIASETVSDVDPLALLLDRFAVLVPDEVVHELQGVASYEDDHGNAARTALDRLGADHRRSVELDESFPLDDGENAAIVLANEVDAALFLCDEFNSLGLIHASLADTRLLTTPTLLSVFVRTDRLTPEDATSALDGIGAARSWDGNSYVERARSLLDSA